ncbi:hypothetical protein NX059_000246 [Plenodomus lindquistii]|nr:hypothetical protein NX059_000246 [Plenodomus lindquistii]
MYIPTLIIGFLALLSPAVSQVTVTLPARGETQPVPTPHPGRLARQVTVGLPDIQTQVAPAPSSPGRLARQVGVPPQNSQGAQPVPAPSNSPGRLARQVTVGLPDIQTQVAPAPSSPGRLARQVSAPPNSPEAQPAPTPVNSPRKLARQEVTVTIPARGETQPVPTPHPGRFDRRYNGIHRAVNDA